MNLEDQLKDYVNTNNVKGKSSLCVVLVVTRSARKSGLPLNPDKMLTKAKGQVKGLGKASVQSILNDHGITRVLAEEGGRTSRGSIKKMQNYVTFLNDLNAQGSVDLLHIENWWIGEVKKFFKSKPFILKYDAAKSLIAVVRNLLEQAEIRQAQSPGSTYVGTVLQHLVGAKLNLILDYDIVHYGASVADQSSKREDDFVIEDVGIHVTTSPSESLIQKCRRNLDASLRPIIITTPKGMHVADGLADQAGLSERIDIFEAEQFLAGNLYEIGKFAQKGRKNTTDQLVEEYNKIVSECETDPSLRIVVSK